MVSPTAGELTERDSVAVAGTFSDDRRVVRLSYLLDGGAEQTVEGASGRAASFRFAVKPGPGEHRLEVRAYDEAGNRAARTVAFTAASVEVRLTAPVPGTTVEAFAVRLHGYIDTPLRVDSVTYSVNGGAERPFCLPGYLAGPVCSRYDAGRHTFTWEADSLPRGDVRIQVFAYDSRRQKIGAGSVRLRVSVPVRYYQVTPIDAPDGSAPLSLYLAPLRLNDRGQVLGVHGSYPNEKLFFWENGRATDLGLRVDQSSPRSALNDSGQVAANAYPDDECQDLFTWKPGQGQPVRVGECNFLLDLDNRGRMLVLSKFGPVYRGALLTRDTIVYLQGGYLWPRFVNDAGQVVGTASEVGEAWLSPDRAPQALGTPCDPKGLNDRGQLLCAASGGFVLSGGQKLPVAGIGREGSTTLLDINNRSQVVGTYALYSLLRTGTTRAFVWDGGRTYAIETRSGDWEIEYASKINDGGVILAQAVRRGVAGSSRTVLLTPEP
ncbi:MAG TPA: hypothetical protein VGV85_06150 [Longimicrobiaceae bacterium]|nr:hypothetical protein [Longimicrobiaceae bacterium]